MSGARATTQSPVLSRGELRSGCSRCVCIAYILRQSRTPRSIDLIERPPNPRARHWRRWCMRFAHLPLVGRFAAACAGWLLPPYAGRIFLAGLTARGYVAPSARLAHPGLTFGRNCFIGDGVLIYHDARGGAVVFGDQVQLGQDSIIQTGDGGSVSIGSRTSIQPRLQISAYRSPVVIGARCEIAPNCAFYPYNHGMAPGQPIQGQPTWTRGGIVVEDDAWLGYGVIVLDGVRIGAGAVIGAGSVVTSNIPPDAIAQGVPARVVGSRQDLAAKRDRSTTA